MPSMSPSTLDAIQYSERQQAEESRRLERYRMAWRYYNGDHDPMLPVRHGQPNDNVTLNITRLIVDKGAAFLFGKEPTFELQEGGTTPEEEELERLWRRNRKNTFLTKLAVTGGIYGHMFVKIVPDGLGGGTPRLVSLDPEYVTVGYADDDLEDVYRYVITWVAETRDGKPIHRRERIEKDDHGQSWQLIYEVNKGKEWGPDPDKEQLTWQQPWAPLVDAQNIPLPGVYYGQSDIEDISEQDAINYIASKVQRIIRYHQHPRTVGSGFRASDVQVGEDDMLILPTAEATIKNLEMQSDLSASLGFLDRLISWYLATARIPRLDPATVNVGALSGFALKVLYGDLLEKTEVKRRTYGDLLVEINRRMLAIQGMGDENETTIHWPDPLPEDERATTERDKFEIDYGVTSIETVRSRRGIDHEAEEDRIAAQEVAKGNIGVALMRNWEQGQQTGVPEE